MATEKKTTTKKTTTTKKKAVKKTTKKTVEKLDLDNLTASATELAYILGIATSNITVQVQNGGMVPDENGRFNVRDTVSAYCRKWREKKAGDSKSELELENVALKNERLKEQLKSWRMQRDREIGLAIIQAVTTAMENLKNECKLVPRLPEAIDEFIAKVKDIDLEQISYLVEGENEDDEEV